jgi:hypothetical protein
MIALPNPEDVEHYSQPPEPRAEGIPLIADDEAVCTVRVTATGSGAYWSQGDVDVHVLHARQHGLEGSLGTFGSVHPNPAWLAVALRERREQRQRLRQSGVQSTGSGLVLLQAPPRQILLPGRP